jgi:hypothetical protein
MSDKFGNPARIAVNVPVSAMAGGSWVATKHGRDLDQAKAELARDWLTRLQDFLDKDPGMAPALERLIANPSAPAGPVSRTRVHPAADRRDVRRGQCDGSRRRRDRHFGDMFPRATVELCSRCVLVFGAVADRNERGCRYCIGGIAGWMPTTRPDR